ncbi:MAG: G8 domain-containing protein [Dokdonella sp.]
MLKRIALAWGVLACTLFVALPASAIAAGGVAPATTEVEATGPKAVEIQQAGPAVYPSVPTVASNYAYATGTTGSFTDMSSGTTTLLAANLDDSASALTAIGFNFYFQGALQTQFSVNSNGSIRLGAAASTTAYNPLGVAASNVITAYGADQRTHLTGKVHSKVIGTAPNRQLVVEFLNMQANFNAGGTPDLTYQVVLTETTGNIGFVYGSMDMSVAGAADGNASSPQIGFSSSNAAGTVGSITADQSGAPPPSFDGASATPVDNLYLAGSIVVLSSATDGSRRTFDFTPPVPAAPTFLTFAPVAATSMTLNWTDNATNELGFTINRSLDGITYSAVGTAAANANTFNDAGLAPSTVYFYQVIAFSEGAVSTALSGSQSTIAAANIMSTGAGGPWNTPGTWSGGVVPSAGDNVTIAAGTTVTIDLPTANALNLTVANGGNLVYQDTPAASLVVATSATIAAGGTFASAAAGTTLTHALSVGADLTNNGTLDFSTNGNTAAAVITFTGATSNTFGGTGATTDVRAITVNKGVSRLNTIELTATNFTVQGVSTDVAGFLTLTNGTFKLSGSFAGTNRVFAIPAYVIPANGGFWLNNASYSVAGQNASATSSGLLRITTGTFNIGTGTGNSMGFLAGSATTVEGGSVIATGRFGVAAAGNIITYTQTAGDVTVCTVGNASATLGSFDLGTSASSTITISGGTINPQLSATTIDYRDQAGSGTVGVTGGTLRLGNAASGAAKTFNLRGVLPNVVIDNMSAGHSALMGAPVTYNNVSLNITISSGTTFNPGNNVFLFNGITITNNGTLTHNGAASNFVTFNPAPVSYTGVGVVTAPMSALSLQSGNMTIDPASPNIVVATVRLFVGGFINANKLTLGNAGATTGTVQIGNTTTPTAAGTFDVPMTFNLGTGGQIMSYLRTTGPRTTGGEINPTRALTTMTRDDNDLANTLTIAGGDITVTGTTTMTNGRIITGANNLVVGPVVRTNGYVDGNLRKNLAAAASTNFEVGTANGYTPVLMNVTAGTFPTPITVAAVQMIEPTIFPQDKSLVRYWGITATGITADLTFNYLDPADIPGTVIEANLHLFRRTLPAGTFMDVDPGATGLNVAANTYSVAGISTFSNWAWAEGGSTPVELTSFSIE